MPSSLRVLLNDRVLWQPATGIGHYIAELLRELPLQDPQIELLPACRTVLGRLWTRRSGRSGPPAACRRGARPSARNPRRAPAWTRRMVLGAYAWGFRTLGRLARCAVYHEPNHVPVPWAGPILTTVHDLSALRHPEWHPADRVHWYEREFSAGVARTTHFVTVSEFTRREMIDLLGVAAQRITVVPLGARRVFQPRSPEELSAFRDRHTWPREYVLFVGTVEPRKNLATALAAYAALPPPLRQRFALVIAGSTGWGALSLRNRANQLGIAEQVHFTGYVSDCTLAWLCAAARVLLWPSLYEGFGLPLLECMACGTPVIAGRTSAMPELVGNAGLLVNPLDEIDIGRALRWVLEDDALARELGSRGLQRSRLFSWSRCAAEHAQLYRQLAAS